MSDTNSFSVSSARFDILRVFEPTVRLRFIERTILIDEHTGQKVKVLQQMWYDRSSNDKEWRDVPLVEEE